MDQESSNIISNRINDSIKSGKCCYTDKVCDNPQSVSSLYCEEHQSFKTCTWKKRSLTCSNKVYKNNNLCKDHYYKKYYIGDGKCECHKYGKN